MLFLGAFIIRYRIELVLVLPLIALLMSTYFALAFRQNSAVQNPEKLYREPVLIIEAALLSALIVVLLYVDVPILSRIFAPTLPSALLH
jgi:hypothetical protein